jgi:hypothetical protein
MSQVVNFKWPQGEDLEIALIYKEGGTEYSAASVNLHSGFEARMDIVLPSTKEVLFTATTDNDSLWLGNGADHNPNIVVWLPRNLTLTGGALFTRLDATTNFNYDLFLRNTATTRQVKVLKGQLQIERSNTLWA